MGEAGYYLVAIKATGEIYDEFKKRLDDLAKLNEDFQKIRHDSSKPPIERWRMLKDMHPLAVELINYEPSEEALKKDMWLNELTSVIPDLTSEYILTIEDNVIKLYDYVWHLTDWDGIARWLEKRGCIVLWASDEYIDLHHYLLMKLRFEHKEDIIDVLYDLLSKGKVDEALRLLIALRI